MDEYNSQSSNDSDDQVLKQTIAKHYAAAKEKKKKNKEKRFLDAGEKLLKKDISQTRETIQTALQAVDAEYTNFLLEYAATEDRIHHLWAQLIEEQESFESTLIDIHTLALKSSKKTEERHILGLSKTKASCEEFYQAIQTLLVDENEDNEGQGGKVRYSSEVEVEMA